MDRNGTSLLVADTVPNHPELKGGYHPEYEGFPKVPQHPKVKQGDTILLSYPLGVNMTTELLSNDLTFYDPITDPGGPAMTWAMFVRAAATLPAQCHVALPCGVRLPERMTGLRRA